MQDWKVNQRIFQALGVKTDLLGIDIPKHKIKTVTGDLIAAIDCQFYDCEFIWIPAKSYCVALVYATELIKDHGGNVHQYLDDEELLPDDFYFCRYSNNPQVYNHFLSHMHWLTSPMSEMIRKYYQKEIHLKGFEQ